MSKVADDMEESANNFRDIVWPEINDWFGESADLYRTEDHPDTLRTEFDHVGGVDFWVVQSGSGMLSIASRVQTYDKTTFTVRYSRSTGNDTEYQKRMRQLENHYELPTYTVQAYVDETLGVLRNAAACPTEQLYRYISDGEPGENWPLIGSDESEVFFPVSWGELDTEVDLLVENRWRAGLVNRPDDPTDITEWCDDDDTEGDDA